MERLSDRNLYFKNLDASRFFAFILVFLAHCFVTSDVQIQNNAIFQNIYAYGKIGVLGLEYFFVLSSFLISMIILKEKDETRAFNLKNFLVRRSLRVWPLYFLILFIGFLLSVMPAISAEIEPLPPWPYLVFFLVNFYILSHGTEFLFFIAFLWSISIEEQFYLIWSLFMKYIKLSFPFFCALLILCSLVFRMYFVHDGQQLYFNTISVLGNFGIGGLLAYGMHINHDIIHRIKNMSRMQIAFFYFILFASIVFYHQLNQWDWTNVLFRIYFSLLFSIFIVDQTIGEHRLFNSGKRFFNYLGKISYGLYCYHGVVITLFIYVLKQYPLPQNLFIVLLLQPLLIFTSTVLISHLSYRYIENFFLQLKKHFYTFKP